MNEFLCTIIGNLLASAFLQKSKYMINQKDLADLMQNGCSFQTFAPEQEIISCGLPANKIYVLLNGSCLIICYSQDGKASVQDSLQAPQIFGLTELVCGQECYSASVVGDKTGMVLSIPTPLFMEAMQRNLTADQAVIKYLGYLARRNMDAWEYCNLYAPQDTLALQLYSWCREQTLPFVLKMDRNDLAEYLHIQVRSLYRYLDNLKRQNMCCTVNGKITVTEENFRALKEYCSGISDY